MHINIKSTITRLAALTAITISSLAVAAPTQAAPGDCDNQDCGVPTWSDVEVGDYVWVDLDADGLQDEGEPGIDGVVLTIYDAAGRQLLGKDDHAYDPANDNRPLTATTRWGGWYGFGALPSGAYTVRIDNNQPALASYLPTITGQGGTRDSYVYVDALDDDVLTTVYDERADSSTGEATSRALTAGFSGDSRDDTLDFGFVVRPTPPVVEPLVVEPPVVTPSVVVTPPVVTPQPLVVVADPPKAKRFARVSTDVKTGCVTPKYGEAEVKLRNKRISTKTAWFKVKTERGTRTIKVKPGAQRTIAIDGLKVGSKIKVLRKGKVLEKAVVPGGCEAPAPPPHTGFRMSMLL